jgi:hypothetical protein
MNIIMSFTTSFVERTCYVHVVYFTTSFHIKETILFIP